MKSRITIGWVLLLLLGVSLGFGQHHTSNWVHRTAMDSTIVPCRTDSLTQIVFPPNAMGMMQPESLFCRIDRMNMDSLMLPHDSTFIGWYRVRAGIDSIGFTMMNGDSMHGSRNMMQFMRHVQCQFHWDSSMTDSLHRHWRPTGMKGWNGAGWVTIVGTLTGKIVSSEEIQLYSAIAFVGTLASTVNVSNRQELPIDARLDQNYPNPFNPSTSIGYQVPGPGIRRVRLAVYDMLGREVSLLVNENEEPGYHAVEFNAEGLASGVYLYRLTGDGPTMTITRKLLLLR